MTKYVSLGSISRDGNKFSVKYTVKKSHQDDIDHVHVQWVFPGSTSGRQETTVDKKSLSKSGGTTTVTLPRSKYHPKKLGEVLGAVIVRAVGRKDGKDKGEWTSTVMTLQAPKKPTVEKSVNASAGSVTFTIKTDDPDKGKRERHDTRYVVTREANTGVKSSTLSSGNPTSTSFSTQAADPPDATSLTYGKYIRVTCDAYARGLDGNSAHVVKSHVFSRPNRPTIESAQLTYATPNDPSGGIVVVSFDTHETPNFPVDTVKLYRLQSTSATTPEEAANAQGWSAVDGAEGNGNETALTDNAEDAISVDAGTHVWYRVESKHDNLPSMSEPVECKGAYTSKSTTTTGTVTVSVADAGEDWVKLTLHDTESDDDIIRVTWSDYENAWESNEEPGSYDVKWADAGDADVYVKGLESGTRYWFRARAVDIDADGGEVLGGLSAAVSATPTPDFGPIALTVPQNVPIGSDMPLSWTFSGEYPQSTAWALVDGKMVAVTYGTATSMTVLWEQIAEYAGQAVSVSLAIESCGAKFVSDPYDVVIADLPTCEIGVSTLTAQPLSFTVTTDSASSPRITASVVSMGATGSGLDGDAYQLDGDCVWSGVMDPEWSGSGGSYTATVELPEGLVFWDGADYTVNVSLHDSVTGLDSETASETFAVDWAHQADTPTGTVSVSGLSATVTVEAPTGYAAGDRFDLYRMTADGGKRIARGLPFGASVTDPYAPFGPHAELSYMAVTRTQDGDWEPSAPMTYSLPHKALRFDWNGSEELSLPYNIEESQGWSKGFESESAFDGTRIGWWDGSASRTASLKTAMVKVESAEQRAALSSLARYAGPVFVRTPTGAAFPANVVPSEIGTAYSSGAVSVSLSCEEVELTAEHMPDESDMVLPTWGGGAVDVHGTVVYDASGFPMDDWTFIGTDLTVSSTFYVCDPDGNVRNQNGTAMSGYTWDGDAAITNSGGTVTELDGSPR